MELIHPIVLFIGIPVLLGFFITFRLKKKAKYVGGKKVANTKHVKEIPLYKQLESKYKIMVAFVEGVIFLNIIVCLILIARPYETKTTTNKSNRKDIFICMDISASMASLDSELVDSMKDVVKKLEGERIGVSIFNTTTILYVPLTDDYDYVMDKLDDLKEPFKLGERYYDNYYGEGKLPELSTEEREKLFRFYDGTTLDSDVRGSSLIGDGLATCMFSFPNIEEERDRIIIFATDNDLGGKEKISLEDASKLCKEKKITVYGLAPNEDNLKYIEDAEEKQQSFKRAVENTDGKFYVQSNTLTVKNIVQDIQNRQKIAIQEKTETRKVDVPTGYVIALCILSLIMLILIIRF